MANLFSSAVKQHHASLTMTAGVDCVITFENNPLPLRSVLLNTDIDAELVAEHYFTSVRRDFGVAADELLWQGRKVEPQEGMFIDVVDEESPLNGTRFLVVDITGERCFKTMDQVGVMYRVYTIKHGDITE